LVGIEAGVGQGTSGAGAPHQDTTPVHSGRYNDGYGTAPGPAWRVEPRRLRDDAASRFAPSVRQRADMATIDRRALRAMPEMIGDQPPLPVPESCSTTLDALLAAD
jgi:hypothetical protein